MTEFGEQVVEAAMRWVGTPFHAQQAVRGQGCDCKGLIAGVARDLGRPEAESWAGLVADYRIRQVPVDRLKAGLAELFDPVALDAVEPGDIMVLNIAKRPQHLAIFAGNGLSGPEMIHCWSRGSMSVVRVPLGDFWKPASNWRWRAISTSSGTEGSGHDD